MLSKTNSAVSPVEMNTRSFTFILFCFARCLSYEFLNIEDQRIINGIDTTINLVPYILSLRQYGSHICSASIINKKWAVTAAHCIKAVNDPFNTITLCSGTSILYKNCTIHKVANISVHEKYNDTINDYDVAVIQVTPEFTFNDRTKPVALPSPNRLDRKKWGIVCGWGSYRKLFGVVLPILSKIVQCAAVPRINKSLCQKYYANRSIVTSRMTCYGYKEGGTDSCQGDSGGPLVNTNRVLIGITSWGVGCAERYSPGVYTDVISLQNWIRMKTEMNA